MQKKQTTTERRPRDFILSQVDMVLTLSLDDVAREGEAGEFSVESLIFSASKKSCDVCTSAVIPLWSDIEVRRRRLLFLAVWRMKIPNERGSNLLPKRSGFSLWMSLEHMFSAENEKN